MWTKKAVTLAFAVMILSSCSATASGKPPGRYFFASWASYEVPFRPIEEITEVEALARRSYYVVFYGENAKISRAEKRIDGKADWMIFFEYDKNGQLFLESWTDVDGTTRKFRWDGDRRIPIN